jgi:predicted GNAT family acetyltransferase
MVSFAELRLYAGGRGTHVLVMSTQPEIRHVEVDGRGAFYSERDGRRVAEQVYVRHGEHGIEIIHTEVDPSLRGQRVARRLLDALVAWARETGTRVKASCPYAKAQFEKDASIRDVYEP